MNPTEVLNSMTTARLAMTDAAFRQAGGVINEQRNAARELMQMQTAPQIAAIISRLRAEEDIGSHEIDIVRAWVIGDADGYLRAENDFPHWLAEFERLQNILRDFVSRPLEVRELIEIQGVLEDAARVSLDIANYLEKRERVRNFESTIADPTKVNKPILAEVLSRKLESDHT